MQFRYDRHPYTISVKHTTPHHIENLVPFCPFCFRHEEFVELGIKIENRPHILALVTFCGVGRGVNCKYLNILSYIIYIRAVSQLWLVRE